MKVLTVVGTRPEIIRLSRVISRLDREFKHILVHSGQNYDYELNEIFFDQLELRKPDHFLNASGPGTTAAETIGNVIARIDPILDKERPDAFLVLGDTNSCLAALAAKRRKIPVFHMEAGNRCFDQRVPEELNRKLVDHCADINLTYSDIARQYLLAEGLPADRVIKTGSPMQEVLHYYLPKIETSQVLKDLKLESNQYIVVSAHREENIDLEQNFKRLIDSLNGVASRFDMPIILSAHPRTRKRIEGSGVQFHSRVSMLKPLGLMDYVQLQKNAFVVLSDSGTITEESSILNFPAINIRESHERPEGMEEASVIMSGLNQGRILEAIALVTQQGRGERRTVLPVNDYSVPNVSEKICRIILSYTDYVNRTVWSKPQV